MNEHLSEHDVLIGRYKKTDRLDVSALQLQNVLTERANHLAAIKNLVTENEKLVRANEALRAEVFIKEESKLKKVELSVYA